VNTIVTPVLQNYWPHSAACKGSLALHVMKFVQIMGF